MIHNGDVIEDYPEECLYSSCLIIGMTINGERIHVVAEIGEDSLWRITVYESNLEQWDSEFKIRKNEKMFLF